MTEQAHQESSYNELPITLRSDVRLLGTILGEVIAESRGAGFVEKIEEIRAVAKDSRSSQGGSLQSLGLFLNALEQEELVDIARAFNQFLNLANVAEQRQNTRDLEESFASEWQELIDEWGNRLRDVVVDKVRIELVLTAHPTEVLRRTLIRKYDAIASELVRVRSRGSDLELQRLISEVWNTDEMRQQRPTPTDEAKWGLAVVENSLWDAVPRLLHELDENLLTNEIDPIPHDAKIFTFCSWMGGDRDGNPNVIAETTREVLMLARWMSADLFLRDVDELIQSLSMSRCNEELRKQVDDSHEPYRALLRSLRDRLKVTRDWAEGNLERVDQVILSDEELLEPLLICYLSLCESNLSVIANGPLLDTIRRVHCFGVHLIGLDIRQDAARHLQVFAELVDFYGDESEVYDEWSESRKIDFLLSELTSKRPLLPDAWQPSEDVQEVLATFDVIASKESGGLANYVISMASQVSDVLHVALLLKEKVGYQKMPIVPLFETLNDLNRAGELVETLLNQSWYRQHVVEEHERLQVMIGYSDSAKDVGQFAAAWAQYRAQEDLTRVAKNHGVPLTLFHGRGGAIGRGGGPSHGAIMSQPAGSLDGHLRMTEQGEMIRFKLGNPDIAFETLTRYLLSTLEAQLSPPIEPSNKLRDFMDELASKSLSDYRSQVRTDLFVETFNGLTPEKELAELAISSRPNRRKVASDVFALRAIPWVFSWTQVRMMLPAWLGFGPVVKELLKPDSPYTELMKWPFFRTQIELLEMILTKAEPDLAKQYATLLTDGEQLELANDLIDQLSSLRRSLTQLMGTSELLQDLPQVKESLQVRNTYLDPLHLLQAELLYRRRVKGEESETINRALKVTMAGISSGLRNTG